MFEVESNAPLVQAPGLSVMARKYERKFVVAATPQGAAEISAHSFNSDVSFPRNPGEVAQSKNAACCWLGPRDWLVIFKDDNAEALMACFSSADSCFSVQEATDAYYAIDLKGGSAHTFLSIACPLDLNSCSFPANSCARSLFADIPAFIWRHSNDYFSIMIDCSLSAYLCEWMACAINEFSSLRQW